jgi:transcriptional regulator GlxA family with amidase domain
MKISLLAFDGVLASAATGLIDVFRMANGLAKQTVIDWRLVGISGGDVQTSSGLCLRVSKPSLRGDDWLVLPGLDHRSVEDLLLRLQQRTEVTAQIRRFMAAGTGVASICSSAFFLAEAGAIAGRRATVSWWLAAELARRYRDVQVESEHLLIHDGPVLTAGAMTAYFDLALHLVELAGGTALRSGCAKLLLLDTSRISQAPYAVRTLSAAVRPLLLDQAHQWLDAHLESPELALADLAHHCCVSQRTLLRRFHESLGMSPKGYLRLLRVERAKALIETSTISLNQVATRCGYGDAHAFCNAFRAVTSLTPTSYRQRFGLAR